MIAVAMPKQRPVSAHHRQPIAAAKAKPNVILNRSDRRIRCPRAHGSPKLRGGHFANSSGHQGDTALTLK
jgi:hypothetical protein